MAADVAISTVLAAGHSHWFKDLFKLHYHATDRIDCQTRVIQNGGAMQMQIQYHLDYDGKVKGVQIVDGSIQTFFRGLKPPSTAVARAEPLAVAAPVPPGTG